MAKTTVSFEWLSVCSGCEVGIVDLHDKLLKVLESIDIVRLPILMDVRDYPTATVGVVTGALRTEHDVECARRMRETCDKILAFGTCSVYGGPQGSGFAEELGEAAAVAYTDNPTTATNTTPSTDVPALLPEGVRPLDTEIDVDLYLPGCPPHAYFIFDALSALVEGREPEFGANNVCFKCDRKMKHTDVVQLRRSHEFVPNPDVCFLSQGLLCMGSATLDRCLAPCPRNGTPCTGCAGPSEAVILEPQKDVRTEVAERMAMLTKVPKKDIVSAIERQAKTYYSYAMASPVFREKPTFLLRKWISQGG